MTILRKWYRKGNHSKGNNGVDGLFESEQEAQGCFNRDRDFEEDERIEMGSIQFIIGNGLVRQIWL